MTTTFCKLSEKEVINCMDGAKIGTVVDLEISTDECRVTALIVSQKCGCLSTKQERMTIPWEKIEKIGCDVIIVNCGPMCEIEDKHKKDKKLHFLDKFS